MQKRGAGTNVSEEATPPSQKKIRISEAVDFTPYALFISHLPRGTVCGGDKQYAAAWARFQSSLTVSGRRSTRTEKVPEDIALKMTDNASKKLWFQVWLDNGQSWSAVSDCVARLSREISRSASISTA